MPVAEPKMGFTHTIDGVIDKIIKFKLYHTEPKCVSIGYMYEFKLRRIFSAPDFEYITPVVPLLAFIGIINEHVSIFFTTKNFL